MKAALLSRGATPVVCLHGFLGAPEDWRSFAEALGPDFGVAAIPLPGHGAPRVVNLNEAVSRVFDFVRAHAPVHLVGYSMGGRLALAAAARLTRETPSALRSVTLISASPGIESDAARAARARADDRLADDLVLRGLERFVRDWYAQPIFASLADRPGLLCTLMRRRAQGDAAAVAAALRALSVGRQPPLWADLPSLECPVMWVVGERDAKYLDIAARAAALSARGRVLRVPCAGHACHLERPLFVGQCIQSFLKEYDHA